MPLIDEGKKAPPFTLTDQHGEQQSLEAALHDGPVVVYFYPKDDTTGCTKEACAFRDKLPAFGEAGVTVFGISPQDADSKAKFAGKHNLNFSILADPDNAVCEQYGVWQEKSMYGRNYMGAVRTTYIIDTDGTVAKRFDSVKVPGHVERVLEVINVMEGVEQEPNGGGKPSRRRTR